MLAQKLSWLYAYYGVVCNSGPWISLFHAASTWSGAPQPGGFLWFVDPGWYRSYFWWTDVWPWGQSESWYTWVNSSAVPVTHTYCGYMDY